MPISSIAAKTPKKIDALTMAKQQLAHKKNNGSFQTNKGKHPASFASSKPDSFAIRNLDTYLRNKYNATLTSAKEKDDSSFEVKLGSFTNAYGSFPKKGFSRSPDKVQNSSLKRTHTVKQMLKPPIDNSSPIKTVTMSSLRRQSLNTAAQQLYGKKHQM
jgi:hypothetical protein